MLRWLFPLLLISSTTFAHKNDHISKVPEARLRLSTHNCTSPCTITLDGSKSLASKGKSLSRYVFELGNGETIESDKPVIEFTYINFVKTSDQKKSERYKKWKKIIEWANKKFKEVEKFEPTLTVVQSDGNNSKKDKKHLVVKASDVLPSIDGDDVIPPRPDQALSDSTLLGIDVDQDGVRDDVELWINSSITNANQRKGLKQNAKAWQEGLKVVDDKQASIQTTIRSLEASECLIAILGGDIRAQSTLRKKAEAEFYNTKERIIAEDKKGRNYNGATISTYDPSAKEDRLKCEFTIE